MLTKVLITLSSRCFRYSINCLREIKWDTSLTLKGYVGDRKLGIDTGWYDFINAHNSPGDSIRYEPTPYAVIQKVIEFIKITPEDVLIDYGCGSGRVLFAIAQHKLKKVTGVEFDQALVDIANTNLSTAKHKNSPVEIIHMDATLFDPTEGTIIYLFNPFGDKTLKVVLDKLKISLEKNPRNIKIVYFNSTGRGILEKIDWLEFVDLIDHNYSGTTVWKNKHSH